MSQDDDFVKNKLTLPSEYTLIVLSTAFRYLWITVSYQKETSCDDPFAFPKLDITYASALFSVFVHFVLQFKDLRFWCVAVHLLTCRGRQWAVVVRIRYNKKGPHCIHSTLCLHYVWTGGTMFGDVESAVYCLARFRFCTGNVFWCIIKKIQGFETIKSNKACMRLTLTKVLSKGF